MKTVYSTTSKPKFIKWSSIVAAVIGIICFAIYIFEISQNDRFLLFLYIAAFTLLYGALFYGQYKLLTLTIDEEADTITNSQQKKYPLRLSDITSVIYKENRKGRFRHLFIHDSGTGFMEIRTSKENADRMVAQILKVNPGVVVEHANYL